MFTESNVRELLRNPEHSLRKIRYPSEKEFADAVMRDNPRTWCMAFMAHTEATELAARGYLILHQIAVRSDEFDSNRTKLNELLREWRDQLAHIQSYLGSVGKPLMEDPQVADYATVIKGLIEEFDKHIKSNPRA